MELGKAGGVAVGARELQGRAAAQPLTLILEGARLDQLRRNPL